jgi:hypothetical protein
LQTEKGESSEGEEGRYDYTNGAGTEKKDGRGKVMVTYLLQK